MRERVIIRRCESYADVSRIEGIIREGMEALGTRPWGSVLVKPNVVFAHRRYGRHAYTHPAAIEAMFRALRGRDEIGEVVLGERCGVTVPTRFLFHENGYEALARRYGVRCSYFDEEPKRTVHLKQGTVHRSLLFPRTVTDADYRIWMPKLKNHVSSKLTCCLKLNIGILDSRERLKHHDYLLEEKIADLYEVGNPDLAVVDAIFGGERNELVPNPVHIGALIMGDNSVAIDAVCARIMGLEPEEVRHLMHAHRRGYGPISLDEIQLEGDVGIDELRARTRDLDRSFNDLLTMPLKVHLHLGNHPNGDEICHWGCINMLKAVFAILEAYDPGALQRMKPFHIVVGEYEGDVVPSNGERVILVGDCTRVRGSLPKKVTRVRGCPVPVPFFMLYTTHFGGVKSPYLDLRAMYQLPMYAAVQQVVKLSRRLTGGAAS